MALTARIVLYELTIESDDRTERRSCGHYRRYIGAQADGAAMATPGWHYSIRRLSFRRGGGK